MASAATNLVLNGSFETTDLNHSGEITNSNLDYWKIKGDPDISTTNNYSVLFFPGEATTLGATGTAAAPDKWKLWAAATSPDGGNFVAIDAYKNFSATLSQMISGLVVGQSYDLSFYYAGAQDTTRDLPQNESWDVTFGGVTQSTPVLHNEGKGFTGWNLQQMTFVATSTQQLLSFFAVGTPQGAPPVALLDGISLTETQSALPEPATWAMMLFGFGAIGASLRSRRRGGASNAAA